MHNKSIAAQRNSFQHNQIEGYRSGSSELQSFWTAYSYRTGGTFAERIFADGGARQRIVLTLFRGAKFL